MGVYQSYILGPTAEEIKSEHGPIISYVFKFIRKETKPINNEMYEDPFYLSSFDSLRTAIKDICFINNGKLVMYCGYIGNYTSEFMFFRNIENTEFIIKRLNPSNQQRRIIIQQILENRLEDYLLTWDRLKFILNNDSDELTRKWVDDMGNVKKFFNIP